MKKKEKKLENPAAETSEEKGPRFAKEDDFKFVQLDKSIHDTKFETKPTTYFKDAFKRFCKSKSSVVAASILGVLVLMSIFVPVFDRNDTSRSNDEMRFLPPKWFEDTNGFLDGTGYVENVVIDPKTGLPATGNGAAVYYEDAITGGKDGITTKESVVSDTYSETTLTNCSGGYVALTPTMLEDESTFSSPEIPNLLPGSVLTVSYGANIEDSMIGNDYTLYLREEDGEDVSEIDLTPVRNATTGLYEATYACPEDSSSTAIYRLVYSMTGGDLWLSSLSIKVDGQEASNVVFSDDFTTKTTYLLGFESPASFILNNVVRTSSISSQYRWSFSNGTAYIKETVILTGSFRYDYYKGIYGDESGYEFSYDDLQEFVKRGWIADTFHPTANLVPSQSVHPITDAKAELGFELTELGEIYCPIRSITGELYSRFEGTGSVTESRSFIGVRSRYRDFYYRGFIASCEPVSFFLGTDNQGRDFFKLLFSGLLTSLELGVLASVINIFIGVVWGSISGYFGGYVDLFMERLTEILGGMPWIVLMTLIVLLLGSNFWTFLLALCLTGWIGTSSTTRAQFYRFKGREYVLAARTLGASDARLIFRHILPNGIGTIITGAALMIPGVIFSEATISYLLPNVLSFQGTTSFGVTLSNAQAYIYNYPYLIISGSVVMAIVMICFNLFGNGLRDAFNPSLKGGNE